MSLIPADQVAAVDQLPEGSLFSCSAGGHAWLGGTKVTLVPGANAEDVVRTLETQFTDGRFDIRTRRNIDDDYEIQLLATSNDRENHPPRWRLPGRRVLGSPPERDTCAICGSP